MCPTMGNARPYTWPVLPDVGIPTHRPALGPEELSAVGRVFDSRWLGLGDVTRAFEQALAPGGRFVIVDFHKDAPVGPPASMKLTRDAVLAEVRAAGFTLANEPAFLPHQYFLVFTPTTAK